MPSKRPFGMVLATRGLENAFFKDVSNESTTFDAPRAAKTVSKSLLWVWQWAEKRMFHSQSECESQQKKLPPARKKLPPAKKKLPPGKEELLACLEPCLATTLAGPSMTLWLTSL